MEKGIYRDFFVQKNNLSFNSIKSVMEKYLQGYEIFEDGEIEISDSGVKVHLKFSISERYLHYKIKDIDQILIEALTKIQTDLNRLKKLKEDLDLIGIQKFYVYGIVPNDF